MSVADFVRCVPDGQVVLVGGAGVVGQQLVELLRMTWPGLSAAVASRSVEKARPLQESWPGLGFVPLDLAGRRFTFDARLVVALVNDPADRLLTACLRGGVPFIDIARWTARLSAALTRTAVTPPSAPVVFSSGWMGGVASRIAAALSAEVNGAQHIETSILYDLKDRSGDDAVEFMDRFWMPFEVKQEGQVRAVDPLGEGRMVRIGDRAVRVVRLDTPEQATLPMTLGAATVSTRIGFTDASATWGLMLLKRLGVFHVLRPDCCRPARHALLKAKGTGGTAALRVDARGPGGDASVTVRDPSGQAHLTGIGALLAIRWLLGPHAPRGVAFPEQAPWASLFSDLAALGVEVERPAPSVGLLAA